MLLDNLLCLLFHSDEMFAVSLCFCVSDVTDFKLTVPGSATTWT